MQASGTGASTLLRDSKWLRPSFCPRYPEPGEDPRSEISPFSGLGLSWITGAASGPCGQSCCALSIVWALPQEDLRVTVSMTLTSTRGPLALVPAKTVGPQGTRTVGTPAGA